MHTLRYSLLTAAVSHQTHTLQQPTCSISPLPPQGMVWILRSSRASVNSSPAGRRIRGREAGGQQSLCEILDEAFNSQGACEGSKGAPSLLHPTPHAHQTVSETRCSLDMLR